VRLCCVRALPAADGGIGSPNARGGPTTDVGVRDKPGVRLDGVGKSRIWRLLALSSCPRQTCCFIGSASIDACCDIASSACRPVTPLVGRTGTAQDVLLADLHEQGSWST
jgi:hypothetical protein